MVARAVRVVDILQQSGEPRLIPGRDADANVENFRPVGFQNFYFLKYIYIQGGGVKKKGENFSRLRCLFLVDLLVKFLFKDIHT